MTAYETLMDICRDACKERGACHDGFAALLRAKTVPEILRVWKDNWADVYESRFADFMSDHVEAVFQQSSDDFHRAEVFVNEPSESGLVICSHASETVEVGGNASCYVFADSRVVATGHARVFCRCPQGDVTLRGHAFAQMKAGRLHAYGRSTAVGTFDGDCHDATDITIYGGTLTDCGHRSIAVGKSATLITESKRNITRL